MADDGLDSRWFHRLVDGGEHGGDMTATPIPRETAQGHAYEASGFWYGIERHYRIGGRR